MYWSRTGSVLDLIAWLVISLLTWAGGWLICAALFRIRPREQLFSGLAAGLMLFTLLGNLLAQFTALTSAYWIAGALILAAGLASVWRSKKGWQPPLLELLSWKQILGFSFCFLLFLSINRGLALFDDYSNLPLVSIIATGDLPPHYYLNPAQITYYHYGMHILAAGLMRIGGFFPWSALDVYKSLSITLALMLSLLWFRRWIKGPLAIIWAGTLMLFAGGARWLLLFLPQSILKTMSQNVWLIGSGIQNASDLYSALIGPWSAQGDGPVSFPFAFVNGINSPLSMAMGGGGAMAIMGMFLLLILARRCWRPLQSLAFGFLIAVQALYSETMFVIIWAGIALAVLIHWRLDRSRKSSLEWLWTLAPGLVLAPLMGGNLTAPFQLWVGNLLGSGGEGLVTVPQIDLRWPPAILSAHLGELYLTSPGNLLIALVEIGPMLLLAPLAVWATRGFIMSRKLLMAGLSLMAVASSFAPLFIRFIGRDRDITRLLGTALLVWLALSIPFLWLAMKRGSTAVRAGVGVFTAVAVFSGIALFPIQLISIAQTQPSYFIHDVDAWMNKKYWDVLDSEKWVLDPKHPYRPAVLFGRTSGPAYLDFHIPFPEFVELAHSLNPMEVSSAGYTYIYLDRKTWRDLSPAQREAFQSSCILLMEEKKDSIGDFRRLYDVSRCMQQSPPP